MEQKIKKMFIVTQTPRSQKKGRGESLYQEVISRNFQIINELLQKFTTIFTKQEALQSEMTNFLKRLSKVQCEVQAIHNQHRRQNLYIYSNMDGLKGHVDGLDNHMRVMFDQLKERGVAQFISLLGNAQSQQISPQEVPGKDKIPSSSSSSGMEEGFQESKKENWQMIEKSKNFEKEKFSQKKSSILAHSAVVKKQMQKKRISGRQMSIKKRKSSIKTSQNKIQFEPAIDNAHHRQTLQVSELEEISPISKASAFAAGQKPRSSFVKNKKVLSYFKQEEDKKKQEKGHEFRQKQKSVHIEKNNKTRKAEEGIDQISSEIAQNQIGIKQITSQDQIGPESGSISLSSKTNEDDLFSLLAKQMEQLKEEIASNNQKLRKHDQNFLQFKDEYATNFELRQEVKSLLHKLTLLREDCCNIFANRNETKKAILFLQSKIKKVFAFSAGTEDYNDPAGSVMRCFMCSRPVEIKKGQVQNKTTPTTMANLQNVEKGKNKLLKRSQQILKKDKGSKSIRC